MMCMCIQTNDRWIIKQAGLRVHTITIIIITFLQFFHISIAILMLHAHTRTEDFQ